MKYIQSEKNYFYKLYKNGKKKRISFEIYQKGGVGKSEEKLIKELKDAGKYDEWLKKGHMYGIIRRGNKNNRFYEYTLIDGSTRKFSEISRIYKNDHVNIPIFDIVKSEEEKKIIRELKEAGKYDEWFEKGHRYGIRMRGNTNGCFYEWTLIDGSTRKFSTITESYWDGKINTPVFDMVGSNSNYVGQGSFKIVPNSRRLNTFGMSSCSGLTMKLGNQKFLSHIDAITDTSEMLSAIQECLRKQELTTSDISNVKIYRGFEKHNSSYQIINELLEHLSIPKNKIEVIISRDGKCSI
jgi:hypothetical protein